MRRALVGTAAAVALVLATAAPAVAATRYANAASSTGSGTCSTPATACTLFYALNNASTGDEVIVLPDGGPYTFNGSLPSPPPGLSFHGATGKPRPVINISGDTGLGVFSGAHVSYLDIESTSDFYPIQVFGGTKVDHVTISSDNNTSLLASNPTLPIAGTVTVADSIVRSTGANGTAIALGFYGGPAGATATLRNVTAVSSGAGSTAVAGTGVAENPGPCMNGKVTVDARNVIAHGRQFDLATTGFGGDPSCKLRQVQFSISYSNFRATALDQANGTIDQSGGHNQTTPSSTKPNSLFVDFAGNDFHERVGAATIDAGTTNAIEANDFAGHPRKIGPAPDIGAYEFTGAAPKATTASPVSAVTATTATLSGTVIPNDLVTHASFAFGLAGRALKSTAAQVLPATIVPQTVRMTVTGLKPATRYRFRISARNRAGARQGAVVFFTTHRHP